MKNDKNFGFNLLSTHSMIRDDSFESSEGEMTE